MDIQWPLVLFSLIAGTGGSLFAFVGLSQLIGGKEKTRSIATVCALVLIVIGGCLSMLHLASPQNAFAALTNIFSFSGISVELMLLGLTFVAALAYIIVVKRCGYRRYPGIGFGLLLRPWLCHRGAAHLDERLTSPGVFRYLSGLRRVCLRRHCRA